MAREVAGLRQRKKERTRRALVDAAMRLFGERGYEETTIADIASAADVAPRTFFSYFTAKEDVLFADVDDRISALSEIELARPGEGLWEGLRRAAGEYVQQIMTSAPEERAEIARRVEITGRIVNSHPSLQAAALMRLRVADKMLASRLHAAYPDQLDEVLAAAIVGALASGLRAAAEARPASDPEQVLDRVLHLLERGLGD